MAAATHVCLNCKSQMRPITVTPGSFAVELFLWLLFLAPGLIYSIWRISSKYKACSVCKGKGIVPIGSQAAKRIYGTTQKPKTDIPDQIKKLAELKESGVLTEAEFTAKKNELLQKM